ncbi:hypothetical protein BJ508DRAFT_364261 [Ascobolus immersus RN42]|uniref:Uncharacterized protein n=1 Tax=Ascobolus immersus RN42 TaxID=1160509 RepID=A0A3N4HV78_ASCIM|nr:hypothetical protein BJ508DRAFT_364261 [Ascobolus immersus RN42]
MSRLSGYDPSEYISFAVESQLDSQIETGEAPSPWQNTESEELSTFNVTAYNHFSACLLSELVELLPPKSGEIQVHPGDIWSHIRGLCDALSKTCPIDAEDPESARSGGKCYLNLTDSEKRKKLGNVIRSKDTKFRCVDGTEGYLHNCMVKYTAEDGTIHERKFFDVFEIVLGDAAIDYDKALKPIEQKTGFFWLKESVPELIYEVEVKAVSVTIQSGTVDPEYKELVRVLDTTGVAAAPIPTRRYVYLSFHEAREAVVYDLHDFAQVITATWLRGVLLEWPEDEPQYNMPDRRSPEQSIRKPILFACRKRFSIPGDPRNERRFYAIVGTVYSLHKRSIDWDASSSHDKTVTGRQYRRYWFRDAPHDFFEIEDAPPPVLTGRVARQHRQIAPSTVISPVPEWQLERYRM